MVPPRQHRKASLLSSACWEHGWTGGGATAGARFSEVRRRCRKQHRRPNSLIPPVQGLLDICSQPHFSPNRGGGNLMGQSDKKKERESNKEREKHCW